MTELVKVQVYAPKSHSDILRLAIGKAGGGRLGDYDYCSFVTEGTGYFRPLTGAKPSIGRIGRIEAVSEVKIEFICKKSELTNIIQAIKKVHPYEEVALDVIPLLEV